jgi:hypothetical protein
LRTLKKSIDYESRAKKLISGRAACAKAELSSLPAQTKLMPLGEKLS